MARAEQDRAVTGRTGQGKVGAVNDRGGQGKGKEVVLVLAVSSAGRMASPHPLDISRDSPETQQLCEYPRLFLLQYWVQLDWAGGRGGEGTVNNGYTIPFGVNFIKKFKYQILDHRVDHRVDHRNPLVRHVTIAYSIDFFHNLVMSFCIDFCSPGFTTRAVKYQFVSKLQLEGVILLMGGAR
jgi:hypothetical protein